MKTKFIHVRNTNAATQQVTPNGGLTIAYVVDDNYQVIGFASACCHMNDHYNKHVGRAKAQGRLKSPRYFQEIQPESEDEFIGNAHFMYKAQV